MLKQKSNSSIISKDDTNKVNSIEKNIKNKKNEKKKPPTRHVRFLDDEKNKITRITEIETKENIWKPEITVYVTKYNGSIEGYTLQLPEKSIDTNNKKDDNSDINVKKMTPLTHFLLNEKGIEKEDYKKYLEAKDTYEEEKKNIHFIPIAHGEQHSSIAKVCAVTNKWVASAGNDQTIHICKRKNQILYDYGSLHRHNCIVTCLCFTPDEQLLLSGGTDGTVYIWLCSNWECIGILNGHNGDIKGIHCHPTAPIALSVGKDLTLRVWDLRPYMFEHVSKKQLPVIMPQYGTIPLSYTDIRWSPNGIYYVLLSERFIHM